MASAAQSSISLPYRLQDSNALHSLCPAGNEPLQASLPYRLQGGNSLHPPSPAGNPLSNSGSEQDQEGISSLARDDLGSLVLEENQNQPAQTQSAQNMPRQQHLLRQREFPSTPEEINLGKPAQKRARSEDTIEPAAKRVKRKGLNFEEMTLSVRKLLDKMYDEKNEEDFEEAMREVTRIIVQETEIDHRSSEEALCNLGFITNMIRNAVYHWSPDSDTVIDTVIERKNEIKNGQTYPILVDAMKKVVDGMKGYHAIMFPSSDDGILFKEQLERLWYSGIKYPVRDGLVETVEELVNWLSDDCNPDGEWDFSDGTWETERNGD